VENRQLTERAGLDFGLGWVAEATLFMITLPLTIILHVLLVIAIVLGFYPWFIKVFMLLFRYNIAFFSYKQRRAFEIKLSRTLVRM
jgi:uncharacterized membrane protein YphA (DoxX/SURF4 family)